MKISKLFGGVVACAGIIVLVLACSATKEGTCEEDFDCGTGNRCSGGRCMTGGGSSSSGVSGSSSSGTGSSSGSSPSNGGCVQVGTFCNCYTGVNAEREIQETGGTRVASCTGTCCLRKPPQDGYTRCQCSNQSLSSCVASAGPGDTDVPSCSAGGSSSSSGGSSSGGSSSGGSSGSSGCGEPCSAGCCSPSGRICCKPPFCSGDCAGSSCC